VLDENDPDRRDPELDIYDPRNSSQPPYSAAFVERYRAAQLARMRRRTTWVKQTLAELSGAAARKWSGRSSPIAPWPTCATWIR
jgi:hypothetical protein